MDDVKYVCENYKEKSLDKMELKDNPHPYIVFKRPVSSVHVRLFSTKDPQKSLWDADYVFTKPKRVLDEMDWAVRGKSDELGGTPKTFTQGICAWYN